VSNLDLARALPVFGDTPDRLLQPVAARMREVAFGSGDLIRHEGEACDRVAFVTEGEITIAKVGPEGREIELYRVVAIEPCILELTAAMGHIGYQARAVATTAGRALTIPAGDLQALLAVDPGVQRFVFGFLSTRLTSVMRLVEEVAFRRMDERLIAFLRREARGDPPAVRLTHDQIAERLGTVREVVSRLLGQLSHHGLVALHRGEVQLTGLEDPERDSGH
jgi:CRP/FNR family transcriptional regulator